MVRRGFCFVGIGVPLGSPWVFVCPVHALLHAPWGAVVGSVFLFCGVHSVVSYVAVLLFCRHWGAPGLGPRVTLRFCLPSSGPPACTLGVHLWAACSCSEGYMLLSHMLLCFCFAGMECPWGGPPGFAPGVFFDFCLPSSGPPACTLGVHLCAACFLFCGVHAVVSCVAVQG